ncbi:hypothetical protein DTO003C3_10343 [Penicillium roqueforti]|nr:hypothetical protein DTO003C3_10343 [Penicillium roqueforti]
MLAGIYARAQAGLVRLTGLKHQQSGIKNATKQRNRLHTQGILGSRGQVHRGKQSVAGRARIRNRAFLQNTSRSIEELLDFGDFSCVFRDSRDPDNFCGFRGSSGLFGLVGCTGQALDVLLDNTHLGHTSTRRRRIESGAGSSLNLGRKLCCY